ncbi:MAG: hypothetical protein ACE5G1_00750 [bacterium]
MPPRKIRFEDSTKVADRAVQEIVNWLEGFKETVALRNVEADPEFQKIDVDLLWTTRKRQFKIEIKADRWHKTGNFFFETRSNKEKNTRGCFLYTKADLIFYFFVTPRVLYTLPMPRTRVWFESNLSRFKERATTTPVKGHYYTTVGRLVPIEIVMNEVAGVKRVRL